MNNVRDITDPEEIEKLLKKANEAYSDKPVTPETSEETEDSPKKVPFTGAPKPPTSTFIPAPPGHSSGATGLEEIRAAQTTEAIRDARTPPDAPAPNSGPPPAPDFSRPSVTAVVGPGTAKDQNPKHTALSRELREEMITRDSEDFNFARANFIYYPDTGIIFAKKSNRILSGTSTCGRYKTMMFRGKRKRQSHVAYLLVMKHWPEERLRHVDDTFDCSWKNLQLESEWTPKDPAKLIARRAEQAPEIPKDAKPGRLYPARVEEILETYEFRSDNDEGKLFLRRNGKEIAKPRENARGRVRTVYLTQKVQVGAHIISYVLFHRKFPRGNLEAKNGNKCDIHPANLRPKWSVRLDEDDAR